ncbi:GPI13 [[Candida] subhashii]|uniref:GPI13 n=1 Tax=[Candida] subhashii TaxID=561895 RepID=A0A8J5QPC9_9ASCO|nr:GPI13 [[Candida] subhashii]KAG7665383.1 GPI13 [[Candida] subhashii]
MEDDIDAMGTINTHHNHNKAKKANRLQQQQTRTKIRHQKLRYTFIGYIIVLIFLSIIQFIGVGFFTQGFLLRRNVLPDINSCSTGSGSGNNNNDTCMRPAKYNKTVLLVIDALRFDFVIPVTPESSNEYYHNNFPILYELAQQDNGILLKFMADPPTTTLQRLKGLTTGSLPTFIDASSNFNGDAIEEDNWLLQLHRLNKTIAFMGDDTWTALFNEYIHPELNFPYDSLNVWDLHTVDNGVTEHLFPLLQESHRWDLLVGHFLGVDHVGHRYGPSHYSMKEKLNQMNTVIKQVINELDDDTLLIIIGDHGMDSTGNHGGDAPDELESTLFMYSKTGQFTKKHPSLYNLTSQGRYYRSVNQIDLVPTISLLMGLPIPYNNLGFPIDEAFSTEEELTIASYKTIQQLKSFRNATPNLSKLIHHYDAFTLDYNNTDSYNHQKLIEEAKAYQILSLEECKSLWARFDLKLILIGIGILFLALTFMITYSRSIPAVRVSTMSFEFIGSVIAMTMVSLVLSFSIFIVLKPFEFSLKRCLGIGIALGMVIGFWAPIMDRFSVNFLWNQTYDFFRYNFNSWSFMGIIFVIGHCLIFASNSYVVWEDKMVSYFLITFGICCIYACAIPYSPISTRDKILGLSHAITFTIMTRLTSMINLCREEQRPYCETSFKTTWWAVVLLHVMSYLLPMFIASCYKLSDSYHSAAPLWIGTGFKFLLFMNAVYWTFEYIQNSEYFNNHVNLIIGIPLLKSFKLAIARLVLLISLVLANFSWSRGPLCVKLDLKEEISTTSSSSEDDEDSDESNGHTTNKTATILGYGNVYGSSYFLLVLNFTAAIMLTTKPIGSLSISMLIIQILSLLELYEILNIRKNLISPIIFGLLGYQHFFSTGHQATLPSIQWELGFMTTETIFFPFTHLNIALNTFGPFLIICLSIPLITLWRIIPSNKPITVLSQIITNATTLITYYLLTGLSSLIFAAHFRRHLMVWKIFAPRFMLSGLLIIVMNVFMILVTLWFGTGRILTQVNRIFGK